MKTMLFVVALSLASCAPFGDVATPAAETVAVIKKTFDNDNNVAAKLISKSDIPDELKKTLIAGLAQDRQAVLEATNKLIGYLNALNAIKWDTTTLKALWSSLNTPDGPASVWNDEKIKELLKN